MLPLYQRETFDYRIARIHGQLCETARPGSALDSRPLPGILTRLAYTPTSRSEVAAAAVHGKIYAIGGRDSTQDLNSVGVYGPANDSWETLEGVPTARDHLAAAVVREKIYATGGRLTSYAHNLTVTESYDPNLDRWTLAEPLPTARSEIGAATVLGKLYVFGGEATEGTYEENESYDPATNL